MIEPQKHVHHDNFENFTKSLKIIHFAPFGTRGSFFIIFEKKSKSIDPIQHRNFPAQKSARNSPQVNIYMFSHWNPIDHV